MTFIMIESIVLSDAITNFGIILSGQAASMSFLRKSVKQIAKDKIPETIQKNKTRNKSGIFSFLCYL